jgi:hypothetical protein
MADDSQLASSTTLMRKVGLFPIICSTIIIVVISVLVMIESKKNRCTDDGGENNCPTCVRKIQTESFLPLEGE